MITYYILDENNTPLAVHSPKIWGAWMETASRIVKQETIGKSRISTVFLGLDHNFSDTGPPILWETMVFGGPLDGAQDRCSENPEAMHAAMVKLVQNENNP